jgi:hypothetical protein
MNIIFTQEFCGHENKNVNTCNWTKWAIRRMNSDAPKEYTVPAPLVAPVVLLVIDSSVV